MILQRNPRSWSFPASGPGLGSVCVLPTWPVSCSRPCIFLHTLPSPWVSSSGTSRPSSPGMGILSSLSSHLLWPEVPSQNCLSQNTLEMCVGSRVGMVWRVKMKVGAGSQPECALCELHLPLGVSDHSSLQLCQLRAVTPLPHESWWLEPSIALNCSCTHVVGCCLLWPHPPVAADATLPCTLHLASWSGFK